MKKVFVAVALVATMGLTLVSCDKDKMQCWKVTYKSDVLGEVTNYEWASRNQMDASVEQWEKLGYKNIKFKSATKYKNAFDCKAAMAAK